MIIIVHQHNKTVKLLDANKQLITSIVIDNSITKSVKIVAQAFPDQLIIWCKQEALDNLNLDNLSKIFHHKRILVSYNPNNTTFLPKQILPSYP